MTNDIIFVNTCHPPIPIGSVVWAVCVIIMPLVCAVSFVRHWKLTRRGEESFWQSRIITLAALIVSTGTIIEAISRLQRILFTAGTTKWGAAQQAMASIALSHACMVLSLGILSAAVCIGFRVMLPRTKKTGNRQPTGPCDGAPSAHAP